MRGGGGGGGGTGGIEDGCYRLYHAYREYHYSHLALQYVRYGKCLYFRLGSVMIHQNGKMTLFPPYSFTAAYMGGQPADDPATGIIAFEKM